MKIHFIAIGGSVMHQLAISLRKKGYIVSGSDDEIFEPAQSNLESENLLPTKLGWHPEKIKNDLNAIILGMHAKQDNPELQRALDLGIPVYSFPEYIFKESTDKKRVAIGGSHGKTTITSMVMHVLKHSEMDFDYLVGARLDGFEQSVKISHAPIIVCEADEYPASTIEKRPKFHFLFPHIAVISGIAWDHINVFPTFEGYCKQFSIFIDKIQSGGVLIYNMNDDILRKIVTSTERDDIRFIPYGIPDHKIRNGITYLQKGEDSKALEVFGDHNLMNIEAAFRVCVELGVDSKDFMNAISNFKGAAKRLEVIFQSGSTNVYRDFAHAPSKVKASVAAVKAQFPDRVLVAVLELHTFSSLNEDFMSEYKGALEAADIAIVFYSRHALELKRMPFLDPEKVQGGFAKENLYIATSREALESMLLTIETKNKNFLLMSSGNYDGLNILQSLQLS